MAPYQRNIPDDLYDQVLDAQHAVHVVHFVTRADHRSPKLPVDRTVPTAVLHREDGKHGMTRYQMLIGGELVDAEGDRRLDAVNPYTRDVFATIPDASSADVHAAVDAAQRAFDRTWSTVSGAERARLMHRLADLIDERADELGRDRKSVV